MDTDTTRETEPDAETTAVRLAGWLVRHWGFVTALTFASYSLLALLRIAHGNSETAVALVQYANPTTMLLAYLVGYCQPVIAVTLFYSGLVVLKVVPPIRLWGAAASTAFILAVMLSVMIVPATLVTFIALLWPLVAAGRRLWPLREQKDEPPLATGPRLMFVCALVGSVLAAGTWVYVPSRPWVPAMEITTEDERTHVGYVLNEGSSAMVVLLEDSRRIEHLRPGNVRSTNVCSRRNALFGRSIIQLVSRESSERPGPVCGPPWNE